MAWTAVRVESGLYRTRYGFAVAATPMGERQPVFRSVGPVDIDVARQLRDRFQESVRAGFVPGTLMGAHYSGNAKARRCRPYVPKLKPTPKPKPKLKPTPKPTPLPPLEARDVTYRRLSATVGGACPYEVGIAGSLADNECEHGSLPRDRVVTCSCWDGMRGGAHGSHV